MKLKDLLCEVNDFTLIRKSYPTVGGIKTLISDPVHDTIIDTNMDILKKQKVLLKKIANYNSFPHIFSKELSGIRTEAFDILEEFKLSISGLEESIKTIAFHLKKPELAINKDNKSPEDINQAQTVYVNLVTILKNIKNSFGTLTIAYRKLLELPVGH